MCIGTNMLIIYVIKNNLVYFKHMLIVIINDIRLLVISVWLNFVLIAILCTRSSRLLQLPGWLYKVMCATLMRSQ